MEQENMMKMDYDVLVAAIAFVLFFGMLIGALVYTDAQKAECRKAAIEKNIPAVEILVVCK